MNLLYSVVVSLVFMPLHLKLPHSSYCSAIKQQWRGGLVLLQLQVLTSCRSVQVFWVDLIHSVCIMCRCIYTVPSTMYGVTLATFYLEFYSSLSLSLGEHNSVWFVHYQWYCRRTRYVRQKQLNGPHFVVSFLCCVVVKLMCECHSQKRGIPQFFAIYYAMGK